MNSGKLSIIIPARNEARGLEKILPKLEANFPAAEIIIVDDGSTDNTADICKRYKVTRLPLAVSMGNGAAIKAGTRQATGDILVLMDGDGQHDPAAIPDLISKMAEGFDLVVGSRNGSSQANVWRHLANSIYNRFASFMVNHKVMDLTSGFRAARAERFREFLHLFPNGFSYPATSTLAFFRAGYTVAYVPVKVEQRIGNSHIRIIKDGVRFLLILFKIGTLYSPMKVFFPFSLAMFLTGLCYYLYTFIMQSRFTNMSAVLFMCSVIIFLIGLVSEQITMLLYQRSK